MIRHALASAALVAATLVTTDAYLSYAEAREYERVADAEAAALAAHFSRLAEREQPPPATRSGVSSAQRAPSDLARAVLVPPEVIAPVPAPRPSDGRSPSVVPDGATALFVADFETGDFSQWSTCQNAFMNRSCDGIDTAGHALDLVNEARQGRFAARFVVKPGDVPDFGGGERSEVAAHEDPALTREGDERWYEFSFKFDENFPKAAEGSWFIVMQWHSGDGSPPLALNVSPEGTLDIGGDGVDHEKVAVGKVRRGEWVDYTLHVGFSQSSSKGFVEAWENGVQTVERYNRATMSSDENYLKMGIYRGNDDDSVAGLLMDGLRIYRP